MVLFKFVFFLIIARYRLNNTKYVSKWLKQTLKSTNIKKKPYPLCRASHRVLDNMPNILIKTIFSLKFKYQL